MSISLSESLQDDLLLSVSPVGVFLGAGDAAELKDLAQPSRLSDSSSTSDSSSDSSSTDSSSSDSSDSDSG